MLTLKIVRQALDYNPDTGELTWREIAWPTTNACVGDRAGYPGGKGYRRITFIGKQYLEHRLIWLWWNGQWPQGQIDHINRQRDDNRIKNLRKATNGQNRANSKSVNKHGLKGVNSAPYKGRKFVAQITVDGKTRNLGTYATPEEAHEAFCRAAKKAKGEFFNA